MLIKLLKIIDLICISLCIACAMGVLSSFLLHSDPKISYILLSLFCISFIALIINYLAVKHYFCKGTALNISNYLSDLKNKLSNKIILVIDPYADAQISCDLKESKSIITINDEQILSKMLFVIKNSKIAHKTSIAVLYKDDYEYSSKTDLKLISLIELIRKFNIYYWCAIPLYILHPLDNLEKDCIFCIPSNSNHYELQSILDHLKNPGRVVNNLNARKEYKSKNLYFIFYSPSDKEHSISTCYSNFVRDQFFLTHNKQLSEENYQINDELLNFITCYEISNINSFLLKSLFAINFSLFAFLIISFIFAKNNCLELNNKIQNDLASFNIAQEKDDASALKANLAVLKNDLILLTNYEKNGVDLKHGFGFYDADQFIIPLKNAIDSYKPKPSYKNITIDSTSLFASGRYEISNSDVSELINSLYIIRSCKDCEIMIIGHTDNQGNSKSNYELSEKRALSVKKWMVEYGKVNQERIMIKGMGDSEPIADNRTEEGRKKNRRVEIILIPTSANNQMNDQ